jgi:alpha-beta hydrolase superfamily lysophospholipase
MRSVDVTVDVEGATGLAAASTASTVHLPDRLDGPATVVFGYPGGGYGRRYFHITALPGYSQAEHHTALGMVVVATDHLGVGDSSQPDTFALSYECLAAANHETARAVLERLASGTLAKGVPKVEIGTVVGTGQSMGGCLLTVQQGNHRTFDGVALLGWSGIETNFPARDGSRLRWPMPPRGTDLRPIAADVLGVVAPDPDHYRFAFHWDDEEPALMEADLASYRPYTGVTRGDASTPWGSATVPACAVTMMTPGAVAAEAAAIDVPVLVACGERDVVADPAAERAAYPASPEARVVVVPGMAHMHNFARTRQVLWGAIDEFAAGIKGGARA